MDAGVKKQLYQMMLRIRRVEEAIADRYSKQEMRCPVHLAIGQEAIAAGICAQLNKEDHIFSNHRCHAHYLAKGGDLKRMIAELHGKATGCAKGKGGSMHLVDVEKGMMGASALVGGTLSIALGSAFSMALEAKPNLAVAFFGDGATEEGVLYECLNYAALKKLPIIFACENNRLATYSPQKARQANCAIWERAKPFGLPSVLVDGSDAEKVYRAVTPAVERARSGEGPSFFEFTTSRWRDHVGPSWDYEPGHRTRDDVEAWVAKCPIGQLEKELGAGFQDEKVAFERQMAQEIEAAFDFAEKSPLPARGELFKGVYAEA